MLLSLISFSIVVVEGDQLLPIGILIAVPSTLMVLFIGLGLVICCIRRGQNNELSSVSHITPNHHGVTTSTTYATPRDAMECHHHHPSHNNHHQSSNMTHPFYNIRQGKGGGGSSRKNGGGTTQLVQQHPQRPNHFGPQQQYFVKENNSSNMSPIRNYTQSTSPAYASVPICETTTTGTTNTSSFGVILNNNRAPPLPSRPNFPCSSRDRSNTNYNNQGLLIYFPNISSISVTRTNNNTAYMTSC